MKKITDVSKSIETQTEDLLQRTTESERKTGDVTTTYVLGCVFFLLSNHF